MINHELHVVARAVLLDVLVLLEPHQDSIVVVGAQAVYLNCGDQGLPVSAYTTDADLAVDAERLNDEPLLIDVMGQAFELHTSPSGQTQPGAWERNIEINGRTVNVAVDLMVPTGVAPPGGSRGARLGRHGDRTARKARGLEAALIDNRLVEIRALSAADGRVVNRRVAGPTALLIAKAHKIDERARSNSKDRLVDKDAADAFLLMRNFDAKDSVDVFDRLTHDERIGPPSREGVEMLIELFRARRSTGIEMAIRSLEGAIDPAQVVEICTSFIDEVRATWR